MGQHQRCIAWIFLPVLFLMALLAPINNAAAQDGSRIVYVSRTGTKYHYVKDCSGMRNPSSMTLDQAISSGKTPCSNCVHEGSESGSAAGGTTSKPSTGDVPSKPVEKPIWPFVDVYSGTSHSADISWLYDSGVTRGWPHSDGQTEFRPYQNVTRQDMAAFLYRLAGSQNLSLPKRIGRILVTSIPHLTIVKRSIGAHPWASQKVGWNRTVDIPSEGCGMLKDAIWRLF